MIDSVLPRITPKSVIRPAPLLNLKKSMPLPVSRTVPEAVKVLKSEDMSIALILSLGLSGSTRNHMVGVIGHECQPDGDLFVKAEIGPGTSVRAQTYWRR